MLLCVRCTRLPDYILLESLWRTTARLHGARARPKLQKAPRYWNTSRASLPSRSLSTDPRQPLDSPCTTSISCVSMEPTLTTVKRGTNSAGTHCLRVLERHDC